MFNSLRSQRLLGLCALGWLLLNVPLLTLWDRPLLLWGLPLMPLALFTGWGLLIAIAAWIAEAPGPEEETPGRSQMSSLPSPSEAQSTPALGDGLGLPSPGGTKD